MYAIIYIKYIKQKFQMVYPVKSPNKLSHVYYKAAYQVIAVVAQMVYLTYSNDFQSVVF